MGGYLTIEKNKKEVSQIFSEKSDPLTNFTNSTSFVTVGSFSADGGLL